MSIQAIQSKVDGETSRDAESESILLAELVTAELVVQSPKNCELNEDSHNKPLNFLGGV